MKELSSITQLGVSVNPSIDGVAFPATTSNWFWSSSPYVSNIRDAWYINFPDGHVSNATRSGSGYVRLVRSN